MACTFEDSAEYMMCYVDTKNIGNEELSVLLKKASNKIEQIEIGITSITQAKMGLI